MRLFFFVLLITFIAPSSAFSQEVNALISAGYLHEICKRNDDGTEAIENGHATCQAYIAGIVDYHNLLQSLGTSPNVDVCVPANAKLRDLQTVIWNYLDRNAQHDAFIAAPAVTLALFQKYPCPKKR